MTNTKVDRAIAAGEAALAAVNAEIALGDASTRDVFIRDQLPRFRENLERILEQLRNNDLIERSERSRFLLGRLIVDGWPMTDGLGEIILDAEHCYREL